MQWPRNNPRHSAASLCCSGPPASPHDIQEPAQQVAPKKPPPLVKWMTCHRAEEASAPPYSTSHCASHATPSSDREAVKAVWRMLMRLLQPEALLDATLPQQSGEGVCEQRRNASFKAGETW